VVGTTVVTGCPFDTTGRSVKIDTTGRSVIILKIDTSGRSVISPILFVAFNVLRQ
jgi:hypothetical protein